MLSDESSSDSETGRFKGHSKKEDEKPSQRRDGVRQTGRGRHAESDRFSRDFDRKRTDRDRFSRDRDRHRFSRHSPVNRRSPLNRRSSMTRRSPVSRRSPAVRKRHSKDGSPRGRSHDRHRHDKDSRERSKTRDRRSSSRDKRRESRSQVSHDHKRNSKDEIKRTIERPKSPIEGPKTLEKVVKKSPEKSPSPVNKGKRSEIYRPPPLQQPPKRKSDSPIIVEELGDSDKSEEVQPGSYYNMIPTVVKDKSEESSEIDSSDDERLRAKLLNLEKELHKTNKKKKHKRKHKRKSSKSSKDRDRDTTAVEVSSTTDDVQDKAKLDTNGQSEPIEEVTSTQKSTQKESCEEGEISSDDDSQGPIDIDPTDLRHKLRRSVKSDPKAAEDVCGPALPPHLTKRYKKSVSPEIEGPALPPHLQRKPKHVGPSIPDDLRKVLAENEREVIHNESSDEDAGIGPVPVGAEASGKLSDAHRRLEERALDIKIRKLEGHSGDKVKSREQWMLELPEGKTKYLGLEARSFRAKEGPDMSDRSSWTDTPEEKARKATGQMKEEDLDTALQREARERQIANRDEDQEMAVKKHKKKHKRDESLLDMHQKKLKKKKKKEEKEDGKKERRPFSRDVDLQVNRFDDAQKKSIIKKAQDLNTRFSRGDAKFL